ncbi:two-component system, OmpR family, sensor kinase [Parafrankia irregularis]|uniref:histidine kinase n=1 Tax=Parafrankia irregularis TaxID=795642 RepID=A0A0S4QRL0_9ACTN|nr:MULTISPECIES: HAMP domain-containing sensor histidine kinase [Parafrankia]MBE3206070.1 HAMP domain-containing histidine kinase [Parafrankia sp. CH37]CUU57046.1 two-component system, OmpR family, sensor kinase [Parafrankia irregularis]
MTLRARLMFGLLGLMAVCLTVAGAASVLALRSHLVDQTDRRLRAAQSLFETRAATALSQLAPLLHGVGLQQAVAPTDFIVEMREPDGSLTVLTGLAETPAAGSSGAGGSGTGSSGGGGSGTGSLLAAVPDLDRRIASGAPFGLVAGGVRYRAVVGELPSGVTALVALPMRPVVETTGQLILIEVLAGAAVLALGGASAWFLLGRGLRPLRDITDTAVAIAGGDLTRRVAHGPPRSETGQLAAALNVMLAQIQAAFEDRRRSQQRLRRFVADASHELRTPLTSVRGYVDMLRQGMVPPSGADDALRRVQDETRRMGTLVDDMLYLAHLDEARPLARDEVDLAVVVRDAVTDAAAVEPDRPLTVLGPSACPVVGDRDALRQVIGNLLANVRVHTPAGTPAEVSLRGPVDGQVELRVRDDGPGMAPADLDRIFDRFYRSAAGRERGRGGSGLGMAIVAAVAAAHGGSAHAQASADDGSGLTVRIVLPG